VKNVLESDVCSPLPQNPTMRFNLDSAEHTSYPHRPPFHQRLEVPSCVYPNTLCGLFIFRLKEGYYYTLYPSIRSTSKSRSNGFRFNERKVHSYQQ